MKGNNQYFKSWGETNIKRADIFKAGIACSIESLYICNQENRASEIKLYLHKLLSELGAEQPVYKATALAEGNIIKKKETIQFITNPIFLEEGDKLSAGLLQGNKGSFVISYREMVSQKDKTKIYNLNR